MLYSAFFYLLFFFSNPMTFHGFFHDLIQFSITLGHCISWIYSVYVSTVVPCKGIWTPEYGKFLPVGSWIWKNKIAWGWSESLELESGIQLKESLWLESRIQALLTETEIQYLESQIQNPRLFWIPLHAAATVFFDKASDSELLSRGALTSIIMTNS